MSRNVISHNVEGSIRFETFDGRSPGSKHMEGRRAANTAGTETEILDCLCSPCQAPGRLE